MKKTFLFLFAVLLLAACKPDAWIGSPEGSWGTGGAGGSSSGGGGRPGTTYTMDDVQRALAGKWSCTYNGGKSNSRYQILSNMMFYEARDIDNNSAHVWRAGMLTPRGIVEGPQGIQIAEFRFNYEYHQYFMGESMWVLDDGNSSFGFAVIVSELIENKRLQMAYDDEVYKKDNSVNIMSDPYTNLVK